MQLGLDAVGNPVALKNDSHQSTPIETYQYDPLYRLQQVDDQTGAPWQSYTYNKTGDRLSKATVGQLPNQSYSYQSNTHSRNSGTGSECLYG